MFLKKTRIVFIKNVNFKAGVNKTMVIVVFLFVFFLIFSPAGLRLFETSVSDLSFTQRQSLLNDSFFMFSKHPLLGVGLNNFLINLPDVQKQLHQSIYLQPVHNIFLLILSQTGVLVFVIFLFVMLKTTLKLFKDRNAYFLVLLLLVLLIGCFDHYFLTLQQGQIMFALLLGIFWSNRQNSVKIEV
jgi:O-antigen ligase